MTAASQFTLFRVILKPASPGTGILAGGATRAVMELAGISDVITKCLGSRTKINVVRATVEGLKSLRTVEEVAAMAAAYGALPVRTEGRYAYGASV